MLITEDQATNLMNLLKIPVEKRNFEELRDQIQNLIEEKDNLSAQIKSKNDDNPQGKAEVSLLEKILNNPGLTHIAENIFGNLADDEVEVCRNINQLSKEILDNPMFWLSKFGSLSKENQRDWTNVIQSEKNAKKKKAVISYLQWNLKKKILVDLPCYSIPAVQDNFRKRIRKICETIRQTVDTETVKILAPLTDNPNTPDKYGRTPMYWAAQYGYTEIVKILAPLTDNPNAPDNYGTTPIHWAAFGGNTEIVKILAPLAENPNALDKYGITPTYTAEKHGNTEIVKILASFRKRKAHNVFREPKTLYFHGHKIGISYRIC